MAVLTELSLSQMGLVTYFATKEWVDLISGNGADMAVERGHGWEAQDLGLPSLPASKEERSDCYVDWPAALSSSRL